MMIVGGTSTPQANDYHRVDQSGRSIGSIFRVSSPLELMGIKSISEPVFLPLPKAGRGECSRARPPRSPRFLRQKTASPFHLPYYQCANRREPEVLHGTQSTSSKANIVQRRAVKAKNPKPKMIETNRTTRRWWGPAMGRAIRSISTCDFFHATTVTVTVTTTVSGCVALPSSHKSLLAQPRRGDSPPSKTTKAALSAMSPKMAKPMSASSWIPP